MLANAGQAVGQAGQGAGQAAGALAVADGDGGGGGLEDVAGLLAGDHPTRAKEAAKLTVKELGVSAKEKVKEIGERRRHRKAEEYDATDRAYEVADELGVDLDEVEGSGADGPDHRPRRRSARRANESRAAERDGRAARRRRDRRRGAARSALRFNRKPETDGRVRDRPGESDSQTERENLPEEVEPGVTYRDVRVRWRGGARILVQAPDAPNPDIRGR